MYGKKKLHTIYISCFVFHVHDELIDFSNDFVIYVTTALMRFPLDSVMRITKDITENSI